MGFFKRKKDEEIKIQLEREALDKLNGNRVEIFEIPDNSSNNNSMNSDWEISGKTKAPHTITAEELNSKAHKPKADNFDILTEEIPMSKSAKNDSSPSDFLYQKMMQSRIAVSDNTPKASTTQIDTFNISEEKNEMAPAEGNYVPLDINLVIDELKNSANPTVKEEKKAEESFTQKSDHTSVISDDTQKTNSETTDSKVSVSSVNTEDISKIGSNAEERRATLLARCNAYLEDDAGVTKVNTEKYKLESVESILEGFEARAAERVNKKFNTASTNSTPSPTVTKKPTASESIKHEPSSDTVIFNKPVSSQKNSLDDTRIIPDTKPVKHIFTANTDTIRNTTNGTNDFSSTRIISDISSSSKNIDIYSSQKTAVIPVIESITDTSKSDNNNLNLDNEKENNETKVTDDYKTIADRERVLTLLLHKKRVFTIKTVLCFLTFIISFLLLTPISEKLISSNNTAGIIDFIICLFALFVNLNVLADIKSLFGSKVKIGLPAALILLVTTFFSVINLIFKSDFSGLSTVMVFSLLSYNFANRNFYSKTIKNFKIIANPEFKKAVSIVQNKNATKAIVGNSIDGSALICYGGEATNIRNFLRYTYCKNPISEKIQKLSLISIIMGSGLALATMFLGAGNGIYSMYIFTAAVCFSAIHQFTILSLLP